jgi:co-chaperonin GroES (HSP10)
MNDEKKLAYAPHKIKSLRPLGNSIIVSDMSFDERVTSGGIVLMSDDMKSEGIRPRWAHVYAVGPDQRDVTVGQYVLVSHGRWTRGINVEDEFAQKTLRKVDPNDILAVSDSLVQDETMSDKVF